MMNILLVVPSFRILGGVSNHYMGLDPFWTCKIAYCTCGKRLHIPAIFSLIPDFLIFIFKLLFYKIDVVVVNPSLRTYQLYRDGIYIILAYLFGKKIVTFIHGWDYDVADKITKYPSIFKAVYGRSSLIYVLYSGFKEKLLSLNFNVPIVLTTTKVKEDIISNFDLNIRKGQIEEILFLARLEISKGILITLKAFKALKSNYPDMRLSICGSGNALKLAKDFVKEHNLTDITFYGNVSGNDLIKRFRDADVYILPSYGEGMATSVLEAMAFGLPVLTTPKGGVVDFFINDKMGYLIDSVNPLDYVYKIEYLINNPKLVKEISFTNHYYAVEHFLASKVTRIFENDIKEYCINNPNSK